MEARQAPRALAARVRARASAASASSQGWRSTSTDEAGRVASTPDGRAPNVDTVPPGGGVRRGSKPSRSRTQSRSRSSRRADRSPVTHTRTFCPGSRPWRGSSATRSSSATWGTPGATGGATQAPRDRRRLSPGRQRPRADTRPRARARARDRLRGIRSAPVLDAGASPAPSREPSGPDRRLAFRGSRSSPRRSCSRHLFPSGAA